MYRQRHHNGRCGRADGSGGPPVVNLHKVSKRRVASASPKLTPANRTSAAHEFAEWLGAVAEGLPRLDSYLETTLAMHGLVALSTLLFTDCAPDLHR